MCGDAFPFANGWLTFGREGRKSTHNGRSVGENPTVSSGCPLNRAKRPVGLDELVRVEILQAI